MSEIGMSEIDLSKCGFHDGAVRSNDANGTYDRPVCAHVRIDLPPNGGRSSLRIYLSARDTDMSISAILAC